MQQVLPGTILWAVSGSQGTYSDHSWWVVAVYTSKPMAEEHARRLNEWCEKRVKADDDDGVYDGHPLYTSPLDPVTSGGRYFWFSRDRKYEVESFMLHNAVDTFPEEHAVLTDKLRELGELP